MIRDVPLVGFRACFTSVCHPRENLCTLCCVDFYLSWGFLECPRMINMEVFMAIQTRSHRGIQEPGRLKVIKCQFYR